MSPAHRDQPVVFVSHSADRSGAPRMLLHVVRWLRANTDLRFRVVLLGDGPLADEFRAVVQTSVVDFHHADHLSLFERVLDRAGWSRTANKLRDRRARRAVRPVLADAGLLYLNTARAARTLAYLAPPLPPVVLHLHEMAYMLEDCLPGSRGAAVMAQVASVVAASEAVRTDLLSTHRVRPEQVEVVYECIEADRLARQVVDPDGCRRALGIAAGEPVVLASGVLDWRKSPDLFVQLAATVHRRLDGPVHFVWLGGEPVEPLMTQLLLDARRAGVDGALHFVAEVPDAADFLATADVFALTAREDPFPLVCLEAAALGTPLVCFDSSGTAEFVGTEAGVVVRHLDMEAMADAVCTLLTDDGLRGRMGAAAATRARDFDVGHIAPRIAAVVTRLLPD
jgi:glycosyltransferase involved in cell wall biosynthesis